MTKIWSIVEAGEHFFALLDAAETEGEQIIQSGDRRFLLVSIKRDHEGSATDFLRKDGPLGDDQESP